MKNYKNISTHYHHPSCLWYGKKKYISRWYAGYIWKMKELVKLLKWCFSDMHIVYTNVFCVELTIFQNFMQLKLYSWHLKYATITYLHPIPPSTYIFYIMSWWNKTEIYGIFTATFPSKKSSIHPQIASVYCASQSELLSTWWTD